MATYPPISYRIFGQKLELICLSNPIFDWSGAVSQADKKSRLYNWASPIFVFKQKLWYLGLK